MTDAELAASFAIAKAKRAGRAEVDADDLLVGCLRVVSQFGIAQVGDWAIDLEPLGVDWLEHAPNGGVKVAYSKTVVELFDRAARIARAEGSGTIRVGDLLAAFAGEESGLMGELKRAHGVTNASWRAAVARVSSGRSASAVRPDRAASAGVREYLSPEEAAGVLGVHVQTLRAYVRSGKLPAHRLAGERAIRIRRSDLEAVLEPLAPQD